MERCIIYHSKVCYLKDRPQWLILRLNIIINESINLSVKTIRSIITLVVVAVNDSLTLTMEMLINCGNSATLG